MTPRRPGLTLAERSAQSAITGTAPAQSRASGPRHCWVTRLPGYPDRCPGLLAEWRTDGTGRWFGRVVYAVVDDGLVVLVETWVPAEHLERAGDSQPLVP